MQSLFCFFSCPPFPPDVAATDGQRAAHGRPPARSPPKRYRARRYATYEITPSRQRGASMMEFSLVALPLLLLSVLLIEAAHWHIVRQLAYVALLDSARAGATQHGRQDVMEHAFAQAFLPRFIYAGGQARERQRHAWNRAQRLTDMPAWRIEILQPDEPHTLKTRLTYLHEPLTPLTRALLRQIARTMNGCAQRALAQGFLTIGLELRIERHSPPVDWRAMPSTRHDRVVYGARDCAS